MDPIRSITAVADPALDDLCKELAQRADALDAADTWPRDQLQLCGRYGVFQWFLPACWGGQEWTEADIVRGYLRLSAACLTTTFVALQSPRINFCGDGPSWARSRASSSSPAGPSCSGPMPIERNVQSPRFSAQIHIPGGVPGGPYGKSTSPSSMGILRNESGMPITADPRRTEKNIMSQPPFSHAY